MDVNLAHLLHAYVCVCPQASPVLLQQSAAALSLLRDVWALSREVSTATNKGPQSQPGLLSTHTHYAARITPSAVVAQHRAQNSWLAGSQLSSIARLQHTAVDSAGSDEDTTNGSPTTSSSRAQHGPRSTSPCQDQQQLRRRQSQHHHQQQQQQQLHYLATQSPQQQQPQQPQQQVRYEGHLHAPHGRRHAATRSQVDRFISEQVGDNRGAARLAHACHQLAVVFCVIQRQQQQAWFDMLTQARPHLSSALQGYQRTVMTQSCTAQCLTLSHPIACCPAAAVLQEPRHAAPHHDQAQGHDGARACRRHTAVPAAPGAGRTRCAPLRRPPVPDLHTPRHLSGAQPASRACSRRVLSLQAARL